VQGSKSKEGEAFAGCQQTTVGGGVDSVLATRGLREKKTVTLPLVRDEGDERVLNDELNVCDQLHVDPPSAFVSKLEDVTVVGRDAVMHSGCDVWQTSHGCYVPLFRQFRRASNAPPLQEKYIKVAASVLQFSGAEYYVSWRAHEASHAKRATRSHMKRAT
jgi:hypothetical protein